MVTAAGTNPTNIGAAVGGVLDPANPTITGCYAVTHTITDSFFTNVTESVFKAYATIPGWDTDIWIIDGVSLPRLRYNPFPA